MMNPSRYLNALCGLLAVTIYILLLLIFISQTAKAENLGTFGEVYPIVETDFLELIQSRLSMLQQEGKWQVIQKNAGKKATSYRDRPTSVVGITKATISISRDYDPTIVLDHDVMVPTNGKIIARAGTSVNPLVYHSLNKALIFYDADDKDQVKWALAQDKSLKGEDKLILVNGSVLDQEKLFNKPIYFDQSGKLITRFGIQHVPATVVQEGVHLKIKEIVI